ncbi:MAG: hypothetical protein IPI41_08025 [Flavobacteriales bacterium]|nr:hypothetical protein [Flavobacteriales bacterium]
MDAVKAPDVRDDASWTIEENVLLCSGQQVVATLKGVEPQYLDMASLPQSMYTGEPVMESAKGQPPCSAALERDQLGVTTDDGVLRPLTHQRTGARPKLSATRTAPSSRPRWRSAARSPSTWNSTRRYADAHRLGGFTVALRRTRSRRWRSSALGTRADIGSRRDAWCERSGPGQRTWPRYEKNALMYRTNATEKWFTFAVLSFIGSSVRSTSSPRSP